MRSLSLSRNRWGIKRIDWAYQNSTICIGMSMLEIIHCIWHVRILYLTGCVEKECVEIFKEDTRLYPIAISKENKFECVVIGSRGWPCKYRVDSVIV